MKNEVVKNPLRRIMNRKVEMVAEDNKHGADIETKWKEMRDAVHQNKKHNRQKTQRGNTWKHNMKKKKL